MDARIKAGQVWQPRVARNAGTGSRVPPARHILAVRMAERSGVVSHNGPELRIHWTTSQRVLSTWQMVVARCPHARPGGTACWADQFEAWIAANDAELVEGDKGDKDE